MICGLGWVLYWKCIIGYFTGSKIAVTTVGLSVNWGGGGAGGGWYSAVTLVLHLAVLFQWLKSSLAVCPTLSEF